jgi:hypothetical protein
MQWANIHAVLEEVDSDICEVTGRTASLHEHIMGACRFKHPVGPGGPVSRLNGANEHLCRDYATASLKYFIGCP